ncbi:hypothetical protein D3Z36_01905 [Lachnospiraceae bacterium]|nr:hypothetical protein [Lachnospiraceae bacterium]
MKVKTIVKGTAAILTSISLFFSSMPVMATESDSTPQMEAGEQPPAPAEGPQEQRQPKTAESEVIQQPQEPTKEEEAQEPEQQQPQEPVKEEAQEPTKEEEAQEPEQEEEAQEPEQQQPQKPEQEEETQKPEQQPEEEKSETDKPKDKADKDKTDDSAAEEETEKEETVPQVFSLEQLPSVEGSIAVDGDLSDWAKVTERASDASNVDSWKTAFSADGSTLYFSYTGSAGTEWDYGFAGSGNSFRFTYADGTSAEDASLSINAWQTGAAVKNAWYGDVQGASAAVKNEAHGNNAGPYTVEFAVPVGFFHNLDFVLEFGGVSIASRDIERVNGQPVEVQPQPVYTGIAIDGSYTDWAAVAKTDVDCPNEQHKGCLSQAAAIYDGDWFYIYIKDGKGGNASGAGTHANGKFAIVSDLGYETDIQLRTTPAVGGVDGALAAYVGSEWEIAIPKDQLPKYRESLSFGFYEGDVIISGIVNLQPDNGNNLENLFNGIHYDGSYDDWEDYGHSTIEYATAGSQESQIDAKGALYFNGEKLFAHVVTNMPQHLQEAGGEFTAAVTIAFNQKQSDLQNGAYDSKMAFYPMFVTVDANGAINWGPQLSGLPEGTYEYYIASADAWRTSTNINNLNEMDQLYGKMMMTVGKDGKDEMELYLELPMIARKLGVDKTDLKEIAAQFGRIGRQWIYTAGASTGPVAGVSLCVAAAGLILLYKKKNLLEMLIASAK